jgi:thiol-disulfide isomerase/thioredoxin
MSLKLYFIIICLLFGAKALPQSHLKPGNYRAVVIREDGREVVFDLEIKINDKQTQLFIINGEEKIDLNLLRITGDSVYFNMPVFESEFKTALQPDGSLKGTWYKAIASKIQEWPFNAVPGKERFNASLGEPENNISGRWDVTITRANGTKRKAIAEFVQNANKLSGTFLTPSGDYRYLEGIVTGNRLLLSTFDGAHAYTFSATVQDNKTIKEGFFGSGISGAETWEAIRNETVLPPVQEQQTTFQPGQSTLNFTFNDLYGKPVSFNDKRFENKVVVVQLMGSWCPNCMDETKFLSDYYNTGRNRDVEIIALAYEYSTDFDRSVKSLKKVKDRFNVQYPILVTGAAAGDDKKTEKSLPQLTPIRSFPTTLIFDRLGLIRQIHGTFYGPGSGKYFEDFKKSFLGKIDELLAE